MDKKNEDELLIVQDYLNNIIDDSTNYFMTLRVNSNSIGIHLASPESINIRELQINTIEFLLLWFAKLNTVDKKLNKQILENGLEKGYSFFREEDFSHLYEHHCNIADEEDYINSRLTEKLTLMTSSILNLYEVKKYNKFYSAIFGFSFFRKRFNKEVISISQFMYSYFWVTYFLKIILNKKDIEIEEEFNNYKKIIKMLHAK